MKAIDITRKIGHAIMVGFAHLMVTGLVIVFVSGMGLALGTLLGAASTISFREWLTAGFIVSIFLGFIGLLQWSCIYVGRYWAERNFKKHPPTH